MDGTIGEIRMFAGNFAPQNWLYCDGQSLQIMQYQALYSLLGITFGGNGTTTFNLPDFRSRVPVHRGHGTGLSQYNMGQIAGVENVALTVSQIPTHTHNVNASSALATVAPASGNLIASSTKTTLNFAPGTTKPDVMLSADTINPAGQSQAHNNIQPLLVVGFIICVNGMFPVRPS
ncbi:phage tail protein [Mucilaginibacter sp. AW1-3]